MTEEFGPYLKHERELRGISLEEVSSSTKINVCYLNALENDNLSELPGEVFVRGYIRSYANCIGADEEEMLIAYDEVIGKPRKEKLEKFFLDKEISQQKKQKWIGFMIAGIMITGLIAGGTWLGSGSNGYLDPDQTDSPEKLVAKTVSPWVDPGISGNILNFESQKDSFFMDLGNGTGMPGIFQETSEPDKIINFNRLTGVSETLMSGIQEISSSQTPVEDNHPGGSDNLNPKTLGKGKPFKEGPKIFIQGDVKENAIKLPENGGTILPKSINIKKVETAPLVLVIRAKESSWFNLKIDNSREEDFILSTGASKKFFADDLIRVWIGNGSGTELILNGRVLNLPDSSDNVIRDLVINARLLE